MWSTPGHTQFRGKRYCPHAPGQIPKDDWLALRRKEAGIAPGPCNVPRNSLWRKKTRGEPRKYSCRKCGETINTGTSTGHIKWSGSIYCPNIPGQISAKEWIDERRKKDKDEHEEEEEDDEEEEDEEEENDEDNEDDDKEEEDEDDEEEEEEDDDEEEEEDEDDEEEEEDDEDNEDDDEGEEEEEDNDDDEEEDEEEDDDEEEDNDNDEEEDEEEDDDEEEDNDDNEEEDEEEDDDEEEDEDEEEEEERPRKVYTCRVCNQPMKGTGHTHFKGIRYCPNAPQQIPLDEWLTHRHIEEKFFNSGPQ